MVNRSVLMKLACFKEIFPGPAKSHPVDARKMLEMFSLKDKLLLVREVSQEGAGARVTVQIKELTRRRLLPSEAAPLSAGRVGDQGKRDPSDVPDSRVVLTLRLL